MITPHRSCAMLFLLLVAQTTAAQVSGNAGTSDSAEQARGSTVPAPERATTSKIALVTPRSAATQGVPSTNPESAAEPEPAPAAAPAAGAAPAAEATGASAAPAPGATPAARTGRAPSADDRRASAGQSSQPAEASDGAQAAPGGVKTLSGMSILGNQEAPKSLVIVPWKSSEIGEGVGVSRALDTSIRPVDKDVFMRELKYYDIRESGEK